MKAYQSDLLLLLSKALFGREIRLSDPDWMQILKEARNQTVVQLAYSAVDKSALSPEEAKCWKQAAAIDLANSIKVGDDHSQLNEWMTGIPYVILKGAASASYYPTPVYRSMGDVDFLVRPEDLEKAGRILEGHGLKPWNERHISHIVYRSPRLHYEMHFNLAGTPNGTAGELVREYTRDIFDKAKEETIVNGVALLPSPFHHGLILLLHTGHHLTGEGIGLRHLCDWAVFENSLSENEFCDLFEDELKKLGLWHFAQILTRVAIKYLGADERAWAAANETVVDGLIEDILVGGNFGKKDNERSNQAYIISSRGKNGIGKTGILKQAILSLNQVVYTRWTFAKKWKIVLPFGWVFFGVRQAIKIMKGERKKVHFGKMIEGAKQRRELYKQFHLYEPER